MGEVLSNALASEKKYDWLGARDQYEHALSTVDEKDFLRRGELQERIGLCLHRAAFQAESRDEFRQRLGLAVQAYEKAGGLYEKLVGKQNEARTLRGRAIIEYLQHWLVSEPSEKRSFLDECLGLERRALKVFWELGDKLEYGRTFNELRLAALCRGRYEWNLQARKTLWEELRAWGERAVGGLSELGDLYEQTLAILNLLNHISEGIYDFIADPEEQERSRLECIERASKAVVSAERVGDAYLTGYAHLILGSCVAEKERLQHAQEALEFFEKSRDIFMKAVCLRGLAYGTYWTATVTEDPDQRRILTEEAMGFYDRAEGLLFIISYMIRGHGKLNAPMPGGYAECYFDSAEWEVDPDKKLALLEKSERDGQKALKVAEDSDVPITINRMCHILSRTLTSRAKVEKNVDTKKRLLEEALRLRERNLEIAEQLAPFHYWNNGVYYNLYADLKASLAYIQSEPDVRKSLLEDAASIMEKSLQNLYKMMPSYEKLGDTSYFAQATSYQDDAASTLIRLFQETNDPSHLRRAMQIWREEIASAEKGDVISRVAESHWETAKAQDILGEHLEAADSFQQASKNYMRVAEKIPQLRGFYEDYATYMQAWSEIEKARHLHKEREHREAKEHYRKAAEHHKATERWSHLSSNYLAWAGLEEAEDLSRREQTEEARDLFEETAKLFLEAKKSIESKLVRMEAGEEKDMAARLAGASDARHEYCVGRMTLEEARILDGQGDHDASSKRYGSASDSFQKIIDSTEDESDRRELKPIASLCRAWERMTRAEAEASPELYLEASRLFDEAKEQSFDEKAKVLALGHSYFCRSLEAGTRFEATRDMAMYSTAKKHVEAATSYYVRAGFQNASEYAKATYRLFDAYAYTYQAQTEMDARRKAQLYQMAERLLQASAGSYVKAKHPEKGEQIRRLLESVREEQQLAMSLTEILHAPIITSATSSFSTPSQTHETAVGLERFENADIQANLMPHDQEARLGDTIKLRIDFVNAGKGGAQLIKLAELLPETFELVEKPDMYPVEDGGLNMKGKSLGPLRTEEVSIVLRPLDKGTFQIRPRILYLDEAGKYRSHEPEPATITVKELGISGWLRGPTRDK